MKASQIIRKALENNYAAVSAHKECKSEYMCNAMAYALRSGRVVDPIDRLQLVEMAQDTFMPLLRSEDTICLVNYLNSVDKKYASYANRWGHDSKACFKIRVAFWESHIAKLEAQGL